MESQILVDSYNRKITSLRVSITSKCNLNCFYCHNEGQSGHEAEMSTELIGRIINKAASLGVRKVKFSGGEPLVRMDFEEILAGLPKLKNVSATTNGVLLSKRAEGLRSAGLDRVNISLDTLNPDTYAGICQCSSNIHQQVLDGINAAVNAGLTPIKLNMVMLEGINSGELNDMISFIKKFDGNVILQIIEPMDFSNDGLVTEMDIIKKELEDRASSVIERKMHRRKKYMVDGTEIELVKPIDNSVFCANCNRLRVTSDGKLKPCLLRNDNLLDVSHASDRELEALFFKAVKNREPFYKGQLQEVSA
jgi:cyclic pyranopterin phosphate synthase